MKAAAAPPRLPVEKIVATQPAPVPLSVLGSSREERSIKGLALGRGSLRLSLIGGCHADEPVGPEMLRRLISFLNGLPAAHPLLSLCSWRIVPHANPDGADRNLAWSAVRRPATDHCGTPDECFDVGLYLKHVVRERPGDDLEFGFPRNLGDRDVRPENLAVARFMRDGAPYHLHGSFHGMGFAPGPWFLLEPSWIDRAREMRGELQSLVETMGYAVMDVDRRGEKGFHRVDAGFSTRPDSSAMRRFFLERGDRETAAKFRPSSMEYVRSLGGDPLTLVSEMPLFLLPRASHKDPQASADPDGVRERLAAAAARNPRAATELASELGVRAMPIRDQIRLQLAFLDAAIQTVAAAPSS